MADRRSFMGTKPSAQHAGEQEAVSRVCTKSQRSAAVSHRQSRLRYDTRIGNPQGWRSSFMSF